VAAEVGKIERNVVTTVSVIDNISPAIDSIMDKLNQLKMVQITFNAEMTYRSSGGGGGGATGSTGSRGNVIGGPSSVLWRNDTPDPSSDPSWWGSSPVGDPSSSSAWWGNTGLTTGYGDDGGGANSSPPMDRPGDEGFATGLSYVPRDNFRARLHEGEAVLTKEEAASWRKGQVINFNPSINIHGANKSPEQLAREIVKPLQSEMRRLAVVS